MVKKMSVFVVQPFYFLYSPFFYFSDFLLLYSKNNALNVNSHSQSGHKKPRLL